MSQYYYLAASLPFLLPESPVVMDSAEFLSACETNMTSRDFSLVKACRLSPVPAAENGGSEKDGKTLHPLIKRWNSWETSLRNELIRLRAQKLKTDPDVHLREGGDEGGLFEIAREAVNMANPLEAELRLDRFRWSFLDELEMGHFFDLEKIMVYYLKLQLVERRASFSQKMGEEAYGKLYRQVVSQIKGDPAEHS